MAEEPDHYLTDLAQTLENRRRLRSNTNLLYWYRRLYEEQFRAEQDIAKKHILEVGSGTSPLKMFLPNVITSDILKLDHLDIVFDCHGIADLAHIPDHSLDIITLTNVLHHLRDPLAFLNGAKSKLTRGGRIYLLEPYFSALSYPLYKYMHHEPVDFSITQPKLMEITGPLSTANQAMPHMIFFSRPDWLASLADSYDLQKTHIRYFTGISYPLSGGISHRIPVPHWFYKAVLAADQVLARSAPKLFASFFLAKLVVR